MIENGAVTINLVLSPQTCRDCLMPEEHLERMFRECLHQGGIEASQVRVRLIEAP